MNTHIKNSVIEVRVIGEHPHNSSGLLFNSPQKGNSHILTSKHSLCKVKNICHKKADDPKENKCKRCEAPINKDVIHLASGLKVKNIIQSSHADVALISLANKEDAPELQLGKFESSEEKYHNYDRNGSYMVLDSPSISDNGYVSLNIYSNTTANLEDKTEVLRGRSGSPVLLKGTHNKYELVGVITDEEQINSVGVEELTESVLIELGHSQTKKLFKEKSILIGNVDTNFITDKFELIKDYEIKGVNVLIYCPKYNNKFLYDDIAKYLIERLLQTLSTPKELDSEKDTYTRYYKAANKFINEQSDFLSKLSLLEAITESSLVAPKVYSQFENTNDYHAIHLRELSPSQFEFLFTKFYSDNSLTNCIDKGIEELQSLDTSKVVESSLISEQFLKTEFKEEHSQIIAELVLPGSSKDYKTSIATMLTWEAEVSSETKAIEFTSQRFMKVSEEIIGAIDQHIKSIEKNASSIVEQGTSLHMFMVPINFQGELKQIMKRILGDE